MSGKVASILALGSFAIALSSCSSHQPMATLAEANRNTHQTSLGASDQPPEIQSLSLATNLDEQGRALRGYDPVAYFIADKAIPGLAHLSVWWRDSEWLFSNIENRDKFIKNPEQYAPANGGYYTIGVVLGKKLDGDPEVWSLNNGQLYIFLNEEVKEKFFQDEVGNLQKVIENWPQIKDKAPEDLDYLSPISLD